MATRRLAAHKKGALAAGQRLVFGEECGFSQRPTVRRTWALRGQTPTGYEQFNWQRLAAAGAVAWHPGPPRTRLFLSRRPGALDAEAAVNFRRNLRRHLRGPVVVLGAGLPAHRSRLVQKYLRPQAHWLSVARLPAYAPELNPGEGRRADLKSHASVNYAPDTTNELDQHLKGATRRLRRRACRGLVYIKHTGLLGEREYRQLCERQ